MNHNICYSVLLFASLFIQNLQAQISESFQNNVIQKFSEYYSYGIPEKAYLQTDREYYAAGDTVWFKVYLTNGITNTPKSDSRFVYVDFRGPGNYVKKEDFLLERMKVRIHHDSDSAEMWSVFDNRILLSEWLSPGVYTISAYTHWQYNYPKEYLFHKSITIGYPDDNYATETVKYTENSDSTITADFFVKSPSGRPLSDCKIDVALMLDGQTATKTETTSETGHFEVTFDKPSKSAYNYINLRYGSANTPSYERRIDFPSFDDTYDVQFLPEGGHLLAGVFQRVAFKAVGKDGMSTDIKGEIRNSKGEIVTEIHSMHLGMGSFGFTAQSGETYTADVAAADSIHHTFDLPAVETSGCALAVNSVSGKTMCRILATPDIDLSKLGVIIHNRGDICYISDKATPMVLDTKEFNNGICGIALVDKQTMHTVTDRTFFVWNGEESSATIATDTTALRPYSKVSLALKFTDRKGKPVQYGTYSMSVVDSASYAEPQNTIYSDLLLASDLKGNIENPKYYFTTPDAVHLAKLDLLMMTQGWHRFEMDSVMLGNIRKPTVPHEKIQTISGHIEGILGFDKNVYLAIMEPMYRVSKQGFYKLFQLGNNPNFSFGIDNAPYGMNYILQAWTNLGSKFGNKIVLDPEVFPQSPLRMPQSRYVTDNQSGNDDNFDFQSYIIRHNSGEKTVEIEAIPIKATNQREKYMPTSTYSARDIEEHEFKTLGEVIKSFPKIVETHDSNTVSYKVQPNMGVNSTNTLGLVNLTIIVNGDQFVELRHIDVEDIPLNVVKYVDFIDYPQCSDVFLKDYPIVNVGMPEWYAYNANNKGAQAVVRNIGYREDTVFYAPKYLPTTDFSKVTDKRKTIHWEPYITPDSTGLAKVEFYASSKPTTLYYITLEGIDANGEICRKSTSIRIGEAKKQ